MKLGFFGHLEGVNMDEFLDFVKTAAENLKLNESTISNRCKWWNRGYCSLQCREGTSCPYSHLQKIARSIFKEAAVDKVAPSGTGEGVNIGSQQQDVIEEINVNIYIQKTMMISWKLRANWKRILTPREGKAKLMS